jgi:hypothetical protein
MLLFNMDALHFIIFKVFQAYFYNTKKNLIMTSYNVTSFKKAISKVSGRFCANSNSEKSDPKFPSGRPSVSRRFSVLQCTSARTSWQHVRTHIRVRQVIGFPSQTHFWEDNYICLDDRETTFGRDP